MISKEEKIAYGILASVILILAVLITTLVVLKSQDPETFIPTGGNGAAEEKFFDSNIPDAVNELVLIGAGTDETNRTPRWCIPTYYAYRLVNRQTGGYGNLGPWSSYPVVSDISVVSPNPNITPEIGCQMVTPTIGFQDAIDATGDTVFNVHRQVGSLDPTAPGSIVGILIPSSTSWSDNGQTIRYYTKFVDGNNPNIETGLCSGCK